MSLIVDSVPLWMAETNCYVIAPERGGLGVIIDAPPDLSGIEALLRKHDVTPVAVLVTHGHIDHAGGGAIAAGYDISAHLHPDDEFLALDPVAQLRMLFGSAPPMNELGGSDTTFAFPTDYTPLHHGDQLDLAGLSFEVMHTPGHTPGHCCFHVASEGLLFSGDQLFAGSIGRTDLPGGSLEALARSMADQVMRLDDTVEVLPGHGPATTIGRERLANPFRDLWGG